jgi:hypothetical protein
MRINRCLTHTHIKAGLERESKSARACASRLRAGLPPGGFYYGTSLPGVPLSPGGPLRESHAYDSPVSYDTIQPYSPVSSYDTVQPPYTFLRHDRDRRRPQPRRCQPPCAVAVAAAPAAAAAEGGVAAAVAAAAARKAAQPAGAAAASLRPRRTPAFAHGSTPGGKLHRTS